MALLQNARALLQLTVCVVKMKWLPLDVPLGENNTQIDKNYPAAACRLLRIELIFSEAETNTVEVIH